MYWHKIKKIFENTRNYNNKLLKLGKNRRGNI